MAGRRATNSFIESRKDSFGSPRSISIPKPRNSLVDNGIGEATDVLLIDEKLMHRLRTICEKACADSH